MRDACEIRGALVSDERPFVALPQAWTGAGWGEMEGME